MFQYDVVLGKEVIATSKPCNPFGEGFKKGLEMLAEKHGVSVSKLTFRRHHDPSEEKARKSIDARRAEALASMAG